MADSMALPLVLLAEQFAKLPGIGMKTAHRLAYHVMSMTGEEAKAFADAVIKAHSTVKCCAVCQNLTEGDVCPICGDGRRDGSVVCVVETPKDINAFERMREYCGSYHVLHGLLSPIDGITPENIRVKELLSRIQNTDINEIILATNPTVEGEATAMYISKLIKPLGVKVTRLAFGLPIGGMLEYADDMTLFKALENRREI
jgi:recombination protein RecR